MVSGYIRAVYTRPVVKSASPAFKGRLCVSAPPWFRFPGAIPGYVSETAGRLVWIGFTPLGTYTKPWPNLPWAFRNAQNSPPPPPPIKNENKQPTRKRRSLDVRKITALYLHPVWSPPHPPFPQGPPPDLSLRRIRKYTAADQRRRRARTKRGPPLAERPVTPRRGRRYAARAKLDFRYAQ